MRISRRRRGSITSSRAVHHRLFASSASRARCERGERALFCSLSPRCLVSPARAPAADVRGAAVMKPVGIRSGAAGASSC
ncbi:hypothetical protein NDU88_003550 [Pleurodeles waltl]|uniref:Uncharacterized protein n=1 Tax=Pleurodeles waltl TaxID=8319 RepID=A0AAV7SFP4_PLEWA|nr:hypothetical protein NDU88_003550 [Pleurodeles waltl]